MSLTDLQRMRIIKAESEALLAAHEPAPPAHDEGFVNTAETFPGDEEPETTSHIVVGKGEGEPGDEVTVEVLGGTHREVQGFGLAIGCDPLLTFLRGEVAPELKQLLEMPDPQVIVRQQRHGQGSRGDFLQVAVIFFKTLFNEAELLKDPGVTVQGERSVASLQIPTLMPIYDMTFRIPAEAKAGMKFNLIPGFKYGRRLTFHDGNSRWLYYPTEYAGRPLIRPVLTSGWIDVI